MKLERKVNFWNRDKMIGVKGGTGKIETISKVIDSYLEANPKQFMARIRRKGNRIYYFDVFISEDDYYKVKGGKEDDGPRN